MPTKCFGYWKERWGGSSLHRITVALNCQKHACFVPWLMELFALPSAARSHKRCFLPPSCSNYAHNTVDTFPHCNSQTQHCTHYAMSLHVSLLYIQNYIHSSCYWQSNCCSYTLVIAAQQQFLVTRSYIVDFCIGCYQGDIISGIGYRLLKNSKAP